MASFSPIRTVIIANNLGKRRVNTEIEPIKQPIEGDCSPSCSHNLRQSLSQVASNALLINSCTNQDVRTYVSMHTGQQKSLPLRWNVLQNFSSVLLLRRSDPLAIGFVFPLYWGLFEVCREKRKRDLESCIIPGECAEGWKLRRHLIIF